MTENVTMHVEIPNTDGLNIHVRTMLTRECANFVATFAGEWLKNIEFIREQGIEVNDDGELVCVRKHFKKGIHNLGRLENFPTLMQVGEVIMDHQRQATHIEEDAPQEQTRPHVSGYRNGSTCGPDCPTHAHTHVRKVVGD